MGYNVNVRIEKAREMGYFNIVIIKANEETTREQLDKAGMEFEEMTGFSASDVNHGGKELRITFRVPRKELEGSGNQINTVVKMAMDELTRRQIISIEEIIHR